MKLFLPAAFLNIGVLLIGGFVLSASQTHAATIATGTQTPYQSIGGGRLFFAESFTTAPGMPYGDIVFNFFTGSYQTPIPYAPGTAYLLSQSYSGTPAGLSPATPGFLATATGSGGFYAFSPSLTLQAGTKYFLYDDTRATLDALYSTSATGGFAAADGRTTDYTTLLVGQATADYVVTGNTVAAVPEPASWMLMLTGLAALGPVVFKLRGRSAAG